MKLNKDEKREIIKKIIILCSAIIFYYLIFNFEFIVKGFYSMLNYSRPIIFGFVIAFIVNMVMKQYEKLFRKIFKINNEKVVKIVTMLLAFLTLVVIVTFMVSVVLPKFINSVITLLYQLPSLVEQTILRLQENLWFDNIAEEVQKFMNDIKISNLIDNILSFIRMQGGTMFTGTIFIVGQIFTSFFEAFLALSLSAYILISKEELQRNSKKMLYAAFSEEISDKIVEIVKLLYVNFYNFFTGQFLEALILGIMTFIGITILGAPFGLMLGVTAGILNLIPYLGAITGAILSTVLISFISPSKGIIFLIYIVIYQQIDGNYIYPKLVGSKMGIPAFWIIIAITLGGSMMGIVGMIIFVPIVSTLYVLASEFSNKKLKSKNIDIEEK